MNKPAKPAYIQLGQNIKSSTWQKNIELAYLFTIMLIWSLVSPKKLTKILHENFLDVANYISYGKKLKLPKISCFFWKYTTSIFIHHYVPYGPQYHRKNYNQYIYLFTNLPQKISKKIKQENSSGEFYNGCQLFFLWEKH